MWVIMGMEEEVDEHNEKLKEGEGHDECDEEPGQDAHEEGDDESMAQKEDDGRGPQGGRG